MLIHVFCTGAEESVCSAMTLSCLNASYTQGCKLDSDNLDFDLSHENMCFSCSRKTLKNTCVFLPSLLGRKEPMLIGQSTGILIFSLAEEGRMKSQGGSCPTRLVVRSSGGNRKTGEAVQSDHAFHCRTGGERESPLNDQGATSSDPTSE